jgi:flagellar FliL protein
MADDKKAKKDDKPKDEKPKDDKSKDDKAVKGAKGGKEVEEKANGEASGEGAPAAEGAERPSTFTPKKIILFVVLPLLLIIGGGTGAYFMGFLDKIFPPKQLHCENVKEGDKGFAECATMEDAAASNHPGAFLNIPDMIVNLNSTGKQPRFLKVSLKLEVETPEDEKKLTPLLPRVVDQFQVYLRELRVEDLRGTSGIYRMKIELLSRVRAAVPNVKVRDVLFQEILVQ